MYIIPTGVSVIPVHLYHGIWWVIIVVHTNLCELHEWKCCGVVRHSPGLCLESQCTHLLLPLLTPPSPFHSSSGLPGTRHLWFWKKASNYISQLGLSIIFWYDRVRPATLLVQSAAERSPLFGKLINSKPKKVRQMFLGTLFINLCSEVKFDTQW